MLEAKPRQIRAAPVTRAAAARSKMDTSAAKKLPYVVTNQQYSLYVEKGQIDGHESRLGARSVLFLDALKPLGPPFCILRVCTEGWRTGPLLAVPSTNTTTTTTTKDCRMGQPGNKRAAGAS